MVLNLLPDHKITMSDAEVFVKNMRAIQVSIGDAAIAIEKLSLVSNQAGPREDNAVHVGTACRLLRQAAWRVEHKGSLDGFAIEEEARKKPRITMEGAMRMSADDVKRALAEEAAKRDAEEIHPAMIET